MAAEVFLSPGGRALENWRTAFPGLACLADAGQADAVMAPSAPSRVWVDVALPGWGEAVRTLAARGATVVVLSALPEGEQAVQALEAGARGYCHACAAPGMLREVAVVVEHGGFAAAGRALDIPKSRLSRHVDALERRLGVRLLQRSTRRFVVTDLGREMYGHAQAMLAQAEAAFEVVESASAQPRGLLRVACPVAVASTMLAPVLPRFLAAHPQVRLALEVDNRRVDVLGEGFDVALRVRTVPSGEDGLVMRRFADLHEVLVASPGWLDQAGRPAHPRELQDLPTLSFIPAPERQVWHLRHVAGEEAEVALRQRRLRIAQQRAVPAHARRQRGAQHRHMRRAPGPVGQHAGERQAGPIARQAVGHRAEGLGHGPGVDDRHDRNAEERRDIRARRAAVEQAHDALDDDEIGFVRRGGQAPARIGLTAHAQVEVVHRRAARDRMDLRIEKIRPALEHPHPLSAPGEEARHRRDHGGLALSRGRRGHQDRRAGTRARLGRGAVGCWVAHRRHPRSTLRARRAPAPGRAAAGIYP